MNELILLKLGELVLKGLNRHTFEERLCGNIRRRIHPYGKFLVTSKQSTIYVEPLNDSCDLDGAFDACKHIFGIVALSKARPCEKTKEAILETARTYLKDQLERASTFKVESKRADKNFPMTSIQLSQWVGGELDDLFPNLTADMHHPELVVNVEVREKAAYVHGNPEQGAGGLPVSINGVGVSLLSGGIDSPVSTYMMAKRGLALDLVHFFSPPYTSDQAREKVVELARLLTPYTGRTILHIVPFTEIQEEYPPQLPGGIFHPHHAPVHDAHCPARGRAHRRRLHRHRRVPGPGGQPDAGGHALHRRCMRAAHLPPSGGHGQGRDHCRFPQDRHLRHLYFAL